MTHPWETEQGWQKWQERWYTLGRGHSFSSSPAVEANSTEILILYGYWGPFLAPGVRGMSLCSSGLLSTLWRLLPSQNVTVTFLPQIWGLDGIRQVVLADLGEEVSLSG